LGLVYIAMAPGKGEDMSKDGKMAVMP
jgi:hypothetical protein